MNIFAIRPDALGDSLVTFPILAALRAKYANTHITFVGNAGAMPLAKAWDIADTVYNYDTQWAEVFSSGGIRQARMRDLFQQIDLAISWSEDTALARQNLLAAGVKEVIAIPMLFHELIQSENGPMHVSELLQSENGLVHVVEYFAKWAGVPILKPECIVLPNTGSDEFCPYIPPIALHPGSGSAYKRWPLTFFATLIDSLARLKYPVIVLAGPSEGTLLTELLIKVRQQNPALSRSDLLTVLKNAPMLEVARHLKQCGCFVGHDTGTSHLAGLLGIPTLALFGDTYPTYWRPLGPTVEILQERQIDQLPVERVLESVLRMYNTHRKTQDT